MFKFQKPNEHGVFWARNSNNPAETISVRLVRRGPMTVAEWNAYVGGERVGHGTASAKGNTLNPGRAAAVRSLLAHADEMARIDRQARNHPVDQFVDDMVADLDARREYGLELES